MKNRNLFLASLMSSVLLLSIVFVSASDEFWIMEQWVDSPTNFGISTDSESNIIVAHTLFTVLPDDIIIQTKKMSSESGQVQWYKTYDDDEIFNYARDIVVDSQDNIVVIGTMEGDWRIYKYDSDGNGLWQVTYDSGDYDYPSCVAVDSADNIIVTGRRDTECLTRWYDEDGGYIDEMIFEEYFTPIDAAVDSEDDIIVVGYMDDDYYIVKHDEYGELWQETHDRGYIDRAYGVAVDSDDNIVVTGQSEFMENALLWYGYLTLKYDSEGNPLWAKSFDNKEYESLANGVAVDQADNVYVTGRSGDYALTIRYDQDGNSRWSRRFSAGPDPCYGQSVVVDADGNLVVACYSGGTTDATYYIIKYLLGGGEGGWQSNIDELGDEVAALQELIQGILEWIGKLPVGLKKLYGE